MEGDDFDVEELVDRSGPIRVDGDILDWSPIVEVQVWTEVKNFKAWTTAIGATVPVPLTLTRSAEDRARATNLGEKSEPPNSPRDYKRRRNCTPSGSVTVGVAGSA